jgi:hypothetical protein
MVLIVSNFSSNPVFPSVSLEFTNLKAGTYYVTDLYDQTFVDSITIVENGGFMNWMPSKPALEGKKTWIFSFSTNKIVTDLPHHTISKFQWRLFPNPAKNSVKISFRHEMPMHLPYSISNLQGQILMTGKLNAEGVVEVSSLPVGLYFVQLQTKTGIQTKRLLVER